MGVRQAGGMKWILLAACLSVAGTAHAACTGPQAIVAKLRAQPTTENAIALGSWFASHQQFSCAVDTFRAALKGDPQSAQLHYLVGLALVGEKHVAEALPDLQEAIRLEPQVIKPHLILASIYDEAGRRTEAEQQWKLALEIDPHSVPALEGLSADLIARKDYVDVVVLLREAQRTEKLTIKLAQAFGALNYLDEANAVLTDALNASPASVPLASAMTVVLVKQHRYEEAIKLLQHTVQRNPGNQQAEVELFRLLVLTNHIDEARPIGPRLLAQRPHDAQILYLNGIVDHAVGNDAQSKAHLEAAVAIDSNFINSRYYLGMVLVILREWKEAREHLEKAIALGDDDAQAHFELAKALRGLGETDRAFAEMKKYQQHKKDEETALEAASSSAQADKDLAAGNVKEAITHYREATEAEPSNAGYKYQLSIALHQAGDNEGERAQLEEAVKLNPGLAGAQNALGYLLSRNGNNSGAAEHFRKAVQAAPGWAEAWINLAATLADDAHFAEARDAATTALHLDPQNAQARELNEQLARDPAAQAHP